MLNRHARILVVACSFLGISAFAEPGADEDGALRERHCISTRSISKTDVINDQVIIFHMRGTAVYVNVLPKPCRRLSNEGRFMFESSVSRLCASDLITILRGGGFGLTTGRSCRIGTFHPISEEQVEKLKQPLELKPEPIPPAEPEEPQMPNGESTSGASKESAESKEPK